MLREHPAQARRVVIGVPTFRRPAMLADLLTELSRQVDAVQGMDLGPAAVDVLVVDNDPGRSAAEVVDRAGPRALYVHDPTPGLAAVRNRILDECHRLGADLLLCIDDDEIPEASWATELISAWQRWDVAAVSGPVVTQPEVPFEPWIIAGRFYARAHRAHLQPGALLSRAATNNLLVDLRVVRELGLRFDDRFGLTGGEDSMFTGALVGHGHRIAWCPSAGVVDHLSADRGTRRFVLDRAFNMSNGTVRTEVALAPSPGSRVRVRGSAACAGTVRLGLGTVQRLWGRVRGSIDHEARGAHTVARGKGELAALIGWSRSPYAYGRGREKYPRG